MTKQRKNNLQRAQHLTRFREELFQEIYIITQRHKEVTAHCTGNDGEGRSVNGRGASQGGVL